MSIAADARSAHRSTRGGAGSRRRLRHAVGAGLLGALLLAACAPDGTPPQEPTTASEAPASTSGTAPVLDEASVLACRTYWGDPDYATPLSRVVLDRAATAPSNGAADPMFYSMTGDDVEAAFADAQPGLRESASAVAGWFRGDAAAGESADLGALQAELGELAAGCAPASPAAAWFAAPGEPGTKPAALTCADVFDTPGTFTVFANANVLTSNMFKLVGRAPQSVPADRLDEVEAVLGILDQEIEAVDDDAVRAALEQVRAPFADAVGGDLSSGGLQGPLEELGRTCGDAGYDAGFGVQEQDRGGDPAEDEGDEGLA
ncbi:hypothetical protein [Brachybacterium hainanense]|uniref:Uncharacterized protein n=1 Tax=Brachybacterium hainanense TaxID=1541174 RepID=A0ABV6RF34_9MICO